MGGQGHEAGAMTDRNDQPQTAAEVTRKRDENESFPRTQAALFPAGWISREALVSAMQTAWDDWCSDTGCHPDVVIRDGRKLAADFNCGGYATQVAALLQLGLFDRLRRSAQMPADNKDTALTEPQRRALRYLAGRSYATPAEIGEAMGGTRSGKAQGLGRLGGAMAARLIKRGLAYDASGSRGGFPAYSITRAGREAVQP